MSQRLGFEKKKTLKIMKRSSPSPETVATKKMKAEVAEARRMQVEAMVNASRSLNKRLGLSPDKPQKVFEVVEDKELSIGNNNNNYTHHIHKREYLFLFYSISIFS